MGKYESWGPPRSRVLHQVVPVVEKSTLNSSNNPFWLWSQLFPYPLARSLLAKFRAMIGDPGAFWSRPTSNSSRQSNNSSWQNMLQSGTRGATMVGVTRLLETPWTGSSKHFGTTSCLNKSRGYCCPHLPPGMHPPQGSKSLPKYWPKANTKVSVTPKKSLNATQSL